MQQFTSFHELVALRPQSGPEIVAIGLVVIDDENARRSVHRLSGVEANASVL